MTYSILNSARLWHPLLLSGNIYNCGCARLSRLCLILVPTTPRFRLSRADHQEEVSGGLRLDRMDQAAVWFDHRPVLESVDVSPAPPHHNRRLLNCCFFPRLITLFLYMVAELSALQQIINALTGLNGLPAVIVECAITTMYTCEQLLGDSKATGH